MTPQKKPQDRLPKKTADEHVYSFTWDGVTYTLPSGETVVDKIPGRALRDAYMDGQEGQMRLGFLMLEEIEVERAAVDALYSMPAPDMLNHLAQWMEVKADPDAATVGESLSSSA